MNGRLAKKARKLSRRQFFEYVEMVKEWPLKDRLWFAWHIVVVRKVNHD